MKLETSAFDAERMKKANGESAVKIVVAEWVMEVEGEWAAACMAAEDMAEVCMEVEVMAEAAEKGQACRNDKISFDIKLSAKAGAINK